MKKNENGLFDKIKVFLGTAGNKIKTIVVVILVVVIALIFFSSFKSDDEKYVKENENKLSAMEYCEIVENRLINVLGSVKGVGELKVFVMVDSSPTIKYLEENKTSGSANSDEVKQTTIVFAKNGNLTYPIVVVEQLPKITGVLVVATGAKDIKLKTTLINVVASVLNVNVSNVEVLEGK